MKKSAKCRKYPHVQCTLIVFHCAVVLEASLLKLHPLQYIVCSGPSSQWVKTNLASLKMLYQFPFNCNPQWKAPRFVHSDSSGWLSGCCYLKNRFNVCFRKLDKSWEWYKLVLGTESAFSEWLLSLQMPLVYWPILPALAYECNPHLSRLMATFSTAFMQWEAC